MDLHLLMCFDLQCADVEMCNAEPDRNQESLNTDIVAVIMVCLDPTVGCRPARRQWGGCKAGDRDLWGEAEP